MASIWVLIHWGYFSLFYVLHLNPMYIGRIKISMFLFAFSMVWIKFGLCPMIPWKSPVAWIYAYFQAKNVPCALCSTGQNRSPYKMRGHHIKQKDTQTSSMFWGHPRCVAVDWDGSECRHYTGLYIALIPVHTNCFGNRKVALSKNAEC